MDEDAVVPLPTAILEILPLSLFTTVLGAPARHAVGGYKHLQSTAANHSPVTTAQLKPKALH